MAATDKLSLEVAVEFRDQLRSARAATLRDAESYQHIVFAVERLGALLLGREENLHAYREVLWSLARHSPLAAEIAAAWPDIHTDFRVLYRIVRGVRNDAFHQGVYARHLAARAVELAQILEDALLRDQDLIRDYMVKYPVEASPWQPISFIRQAMLENSFSYLPIRRADGWCLVWENELARYLRSAPSKNERRRRLIRPLEDVLDGEELRLFEAIVVRPDASLADVVERMTEKGQSVVLVANADDAEELLGIATAFDLL